MEADRYTARDPTKTRSCPAGALAERIAIHWNLNRSINFSSAAKN
jgi:hypothetical protein